MLRLAEDLENTGSSLGKNSTQFWLREYLNYRQFFESNDEDFYDILESFLNISFNSHWNTYLSWTQHPIKVTVTISLLTGFNLFSRFFHSTNYVGGWLFIRRFAS